MFVVNLRASLPLESVLKIGEALRFSHIITTTSISKSKAEVKKDLDILSQKYNDKTIFVGGLEDKMPREDLPENVKFMNNLEEFNEYLEQLSSFHDKY